MNKLARNWPTIAAMLATTGAWFAQRQGWFTPTEIATLAAIVTPLFTKLVHDLEAPK